MGNGTAFGSILGTGFKLFGDALNFDAYSQADTVNSNELERSARMEDANAVDALVRGNMAAGQARMRGTTLLGKQRVAFATSGVDSSVGTPAQVGSATRIYSELDAQTLQNNAMREALGHEEIGRKYRIQRQQLETAYEAKKTALGINAASSLLGAGLVGGGE